MLLAEALYTDASPFSFMLRESTVMSRGDDNDGDNMSEEDVETRGGGLTLKGRRTPAG